MRSRPLYSDLYATIARHDAFYAFVLPDFRLVFSLQPQLKELPGFPG